MEIADMFCEAMELPRGSLSGRERLSEMEKWDSLALLNLMAILNSRYGITLSPEKVLECTSISDVDGLLKGTVTA